MKTQFQSDMSTEYVYPRYIDWKRVILDIKHSGLNYSGICRILGIPWSTFQNYQQNGVEPRHAIGSSILLIHSKQCGIDLTQQRVTEAKQ